MIDESQLEEIVEEQKRIHPDGIPPLFIIDHEQIRNNYRFFKKNLPRVQAYYAVKANSDSEVVRTLFDEGASFDVASLNEFNLIYHFIEGLSEQRRCAFIWNKIIYAHPVKEVRTLEQLKPYCPLIAYDSECELRKIKEHCDSAGLVLRVSVPNIGAMAEQASKFGVDVSDAIPLVEKAFEMGLNVEGISFHVGSQCTRFDNYVDALNISAEILNEIEKKHEIRLIDLGGGFPVPYDSKVPAFEELARIINNELNRHFEKKIEDKTRKEKFEIIAEPGRFMVANAALLISRIDCKKRKEGKLFFHINDGVYGTFSGEVYDHCSYPFEPFPSSKGGKREICAIAGPTCDGFDMVSKAEYLPSDLEFGDLLLSRNVGAYTIVSATDFNGLPRAKIIHVGLGSSQDLNKQNS